ncbi:MAG TPA: sugar ABC transporter ATP-binding protein, partial [Pirellulales bacterium]|nr:sugar ABC transporter ATP-binding protein [Pirellulales bacterium]
MHNPPLIAVRQLTKRFPGVVALDGVSLEIQRGQCVAVCGENGAGKSTLMKILAGVIPDFEGQYLLRGQSVRFASTREAEQAGVSIIHQELNLVEQLTAAANIFLGREMHAAFGLLDERAMRDAAAGLLNELECHIDPGQRVAQLRVGDQQLVEIAKALSLESEILIMDEPTSALTESEVARLFRVIERLRARGVTILYISHKMDEVFRLADQIAVLRDGRLVEVLARSASDPRQVTHLMVGREIEATHFESRPRGEVLLEVDRLSLPWTGHARQWRLHDISFRLHRGEILGIAGLMGAGRTELLECLFGASPEPPRGRIELEGRAVRFNHPAEARDAGMSLVTEDRKRLGLFAEMSVAENITLCQLREATAAGLVRKARERALSGDIIQRLAIKTAGGDARITSLSGGNQQKAIIGRWLL